MSKSELRLRQEEFARESASFEIWLAEEKINYTKGDAFRDPRAFGPHGSNAIAVPDGTPPRFAPYGHALSCHKLKLAQDLNFENEADHVRAHDEWDRRGGAKRLLHDMNHYSWGWKGFI